MKATKGVLTPVEIDFIMEVLCPETLHKITIYKTFNLPF